MSIKAPYIVCVVWSSLEIFGDCESLIHTCHVWLRLSQLDKNHIMMYYCIFSVDTQNIKSIYAEQLEQIMSLD